MLPDLSFMATNTLGACLLPWNARRRIGVRFSEAPVEFRGYLWRHRKRLIRRVLRDGVPEIADELEPLGDRQAPKRLKVKRGITHERKVGQRGPARKERRVAG